METPEEMATEVVGLKAAQLPTKPGSRVMVERKGERCIYILGLDDMWYPIATGTVLQWGYRASSRMAEENWEAYE